MASLVQALTADSRSLSGILPSAGESAAPFVAAKVRENDLGRILTAVLTTSACLHLLIVGFLGDGIPADSPRLKVRPSVPPPVKVYENVQLDSAPPPPPKAPTEVLRETPLSPAELPEIGPVPAVAAIDSTVKVDFAILTAEPVRIVNTIAEASGGAVLRIPDEPIALETQSAKGQLLSPQLPYPPEAHRRHLSGNVVIEFKTTSTGDIYAARVRTSSGHLSIDNHALELVRRSRWTGSAGFFAIPYEYSSR
jgi:TonB family protein